MTTATAVSTSDLADILGVSVRQLQQVHADHGLAQPGRPGTRDSLMWPMPTVHRLQVAAALSAATAGLATGRNRSTFPNAVAAVLEADQPPDAPLWAVFSDGAVSYLLYGADVSLACEAGGVVARVTRFYGEGAD